MKQLELYPTSRDVAEQLDRHMKTFKVNFTYDELRAWHRIANRLFMKLKHDAIQSKRSMTDSK